jgi:hypothetical protein
MSSKGRWSGTITDGLSWATEISKALNTGRTVRFAGRPLALVSASSGLPTSC